LMRRPSSFFVSVARFSVDRGEELTETILSAINPKMYYAWVDEPSC
jgi:hypothetical protein